MSFLHVLSAWFGPNLLFHYFDSERQAPPVRHDLWTDPTRKQFRPGLCIHGHFNKLRKFGATDYYPEVDQFITFLRDPFERFASNYFFLKSHGQFAGDHQLKWVGDPSYTLEQHIRNGRSAFLENHFPFDVTESNFQSEIGKRFVYIGVLEDFQNSVDRLAQRLGVPTVDVPRLNAQPRDEGTPDELRRVYREKYPLEYQVYDFALAHCDE